MTSIYRYTPYILPMVASAAFTAGLSVYVWRRRSVPGALPLAIWMLFMSLAAMSSALELAAEDAPAKNFWFTVQGIWILPGVTAMLCFALDYAQPGRWLTHRNVTLLTIPPILAALLVLTNDAHGWLWPAISIQDYARPALGFGAWMLAVYGYVLILIQTGVLIWLFVGSPLHRWPVALMLVSRLATAGAFLMESAGRSPLAPLNATILAMTLTSAIYALALFRFRLFDVIPIARDTVIQQMREAMLTLDTQNRIVDVNRTAEKVLQIPAGRLRGRLAMEVQPALRDLLEQTEEKGEEETELRLGDGVAARNYAIHVSPLCSRRGAQLGRLLLLHDVTEQRRAQEQFLEQQRLVATLEERQRLARELHDGVAQMLGYVSMQVQAIRSWVHDGDTATAEAQLTRLAAAAQEAHEDIRESILCLKVESADSWDFPVALQQCLASFQTNYGISTELTLPPWASGQALAPDVGVQLLRVIQEALTNARKHGRARNVKVTFARDDGQARIVVDDDGCGFDREEVRAAAGDHLGLEFMRDRMVQIGGSLAIHSQPGAGTQVVFEVPIRDQPTETP